VQVYLRIANDAVLCLPDAQDVDENMEQDNNGELKLGEDELYAWLELRLHPLLIKAMHRLGFKEPTPIQKACIPAGAHQGKVCYMLTGRELAISLICMNMLNLFCFIVLMLFVVNFS
jgi:hypothetical protein